MTVPPRGARNRRGGRRPGWQLLTALLVLAILASSTLVFTDSVQLLRLAVILSLWAAVLAAFVSVLYRRQSETDQARARDMKFVYDLQLDREISARREYELGVETHLRRQLARERGQAAEELLALRAELVSLRANLEVLLGAELGDRPAIESDRVATAFAMPPPPGRVESSRVTEEVTEIRTEERIEVTQYVVEVTGEVEPAVTDSPIIDVPEEPLVPPPPPPPPPPAPVWPRVEQPSPAANPADGYRGSHRRAEQPAEPAVPPPATPAPPSAPDYPSTAPWRPPETQPRRGRHWTAEENVPAPPAAAEAARGRHRGEAVEASSAAPGRHRGAAEPVAEDIETAENGAAHHTGGHSVADLMARLNVGEQPSGGGRRRREDDTGGGRRRREDDSVR